jgi:DNA-binding transcriptional regulator LsrR (DeoR family)
MPARHRSTAELARDRRCEADLYLQGWLQADIATELSIDQSTVSRDLKALQKQWLASALIDFNEAKAQELAKIDRLEREYWEAWRRSCEDAETVKQRGAPGDEVGKVKTASVERTVKGQAGDPRFLVGIQWCIERRCKVLGIDVPDVQPTTIVNVFSGNVGDDDV